MDHFWGAPTVAFGSATFVVRTERAGTEGFLRELQRAVWDVNPNLPLADVRTLGDVYQHSLAQTSFALTLLATAAAMGLLLGFIGIYGVIGYVVSQRTQEIGIRMALGAQTGTLKRMFVGQGVGMAALGVGAGARGCNGAHAADVVAAVRREPARYTDLCRRDADGRRRGHARGLSSGAPRDGGNILGALRNGS